MLTPVADSSHARDGLVLRGRRDECAAIDRVLEGVRAGHSGVLVLRGEPGVGKSALLEYALAGGVRAAAWPARPGSTPRWSSRSPACTSCARRCSTGSSGCPEPQRDALGTAFGLSAGAPPDRFLVGLAVLSLLSDVAGERPLVCVVDDAQWLDRASLETLAFVARRLFAEPLGVDLRHARVRRRRSRACPSWSSRACGDATRSALLDSVVSGPLDEERARPHRRRDARQPARAARAAARADAGGARGRLRPARRAALGPDRGELPPAPGVASRRHAPAGAGRRGRPGRRRGAAVARVRAARHRPERGRAGGGGGAADDRAGA